MLTYRLAVLHCSLILDPDVPQLRALWSLLDSIWGVLKGGWGVLDHGAQLVVLGSASLRGLVIETSRRHILPFVVTPRFQDLEASRQYASRGISGSAFCQLSNLWKVVSVRLTELRTAT